LLNGGANINTPWFRVEHDAGGIPKGAIAGLPETDFNHGCPARRLREPPSIVTMHKKTAHGRRNTSMTPAKHPDRVKRNNHVH